MPSPYGIRDLAEEFGLTTRTIRFYEDQALLKPKRKGQRRIYDETQRVRLKLIARGRRMGFSIEECRELLDLYDPASGNHTQLVKLLAKIKEKRGQLEQKLKDIRQTLRELDRSEQACLTALEQTSEPHTDNSEN